MKFKELNPILHSQLRLAIMSYLVGNGDTDFKTLLKETESTSGNLSVQLRKLEKAGYIKIKKTFKNNYQHTIIKLTKEGLNAFEEYVNILQKYISIKPKNNTDEN